MEALDITQRSLLSCLIAEYDRLNATLTMMADEPEGSLTVGYRGELSGIRTAISLFVGTHHITTPAGGVPAWLPQLRRMAR